MHFLVPTSSSSSPSPANTSSFSTLFLAPESLCKPPAKIQIGIHGISGHSSKNTSLCAVVDRSSSNVSSRKESPDEEVLVVRRPLLENSGEDEGDKTYPAKIDAGLSKIAKKMPIFEPERSESSLSSSAAAVARAQEKPLAVNLDLSLYRAKFLARSFRYKDAEKILEKVAILLVVIKIKFVMILMLSCLVLKVYSLLAGGWETIRGVREDTDQTNQVVGSKNRVRERVSSYARRECIHLAGWCYTMKATLCFSS